MTLISRRLIKKVSRYNKLNYYYIAHLKRKVFMVMPLWLFPAWILPLHWQGDWSTKSINNISPIKKRKEGERVGKKWCMRDERAQAGLNFWDPVVRKLKTPISCSLISHLPAPFLKICPYSASHCKAELTCSLSEICLVPATPVPLHCPMWPVISSLLMCSFCFNCPHSPILL